MVLGSNMLPILYIKVSNIFATIGFIAESILKFNLVLVCNDNGSSWGRTKKIFYIGLSLLFFFFFFFEFYVMEKHFKAIIDKVPRKTLAVEYNQFK